jgi:hypothetical protein
MACAVASARTGRTPAPNVTAFAISPMHATYAGAAVCSRPCLSSVILANSDTRANSPAAPERYY